MHMKTFVGIVSILVVLLGLGWFVVGDRSPSDAATTTDDVASSPLRAEPNVIVVTDQQPGTEITASLASFEKDGGFVVIHEDVDGQPGAVLGASSLLLAGDNVNVSVTLSRTSVDGETLHAMLHTDTNRDGIFDVAVDAPIQSVLGGPISGWFMIAADAATGTPISI